MKKNKPKTICPKCEGEGLIHIEQVLLPIVCWVCQGKGYINTEKR